jgi:hypothetical protein
VKVAAIFLTKMRYNMFKKIIGLRFSGKWLLFWFEGGAQDPDKCDASCKSYLFEQLLDEAKLLDYAYRYGRIGLWVKVDEGKEPVEVRKEFVGG